MIKLTSAVLQDNVSGGEHNLLELIKSHQEVFIGQGGINVDILISSEDVSVSGIHASISSCPKGFMIKNYSTHGTRIVRGEKEITLFCEEESLLSHEDQIYLGRYGPIKYLETRAK